VQASTPHGARDISTEDRVSTLRNVSAALCVVTRGTLLALAALCNTLEEPRRVVASDDRVLALLRKALRDESAPVRAAAAALARSMSRSVRALAHGDGRRGNQLAARRAAQRLVSQSAAHCHCRRQQHAARVLADEARRDRRRRCAAAGGALQERPGRPALRLASAWALRNLLFEAPLPSSGS
jgi:hypothetical protein